MGSSSISLLFQLFALFPLYWTTTMGFQSTAYRRTLLSSVASSSPCSNSVPSLPRRCIRSSLSSSRNNDSYTTKERIQQSPKYRQLMKASKMSLAPMMEYTDRHFRHLVRLVSSETLLYTEMVAANALCHERRAQIEQYLEANENATPEQAAQNYDDLYLQRFLCQGRVQPEGASVLQLGGSDPKQMYEAAQTVMELTNRGHCDYTAINLNCGCPSPKVAGKGCFGAALMDDPKLVAELTSSLHEGCIENNYNEGDDIIPITVKCRIGTDSDVPFTKAAYEQMDPEQEYQKLCQFIETVASNGIVTDFSVHARIAVLSKSFSPADNRKIPPLKYDLVHRLVADYPQCTFSLNGGVDTISQALEEFNKSPTLNGVMIGRSWAADPWSFAMADELLYGEEKPNKMNRLQILQEYGKHADMEEGLWDPVKIRRFIVKAVTPLFTGEPRAKKYRIALDDIAKIPKQRHSQGLTMEGQPPISELIINAAYENLSEEALLRTPEESYERILLAEVKKKKQQITVPGGIQHSTTSEAVAEWNTERKEKGEGMSYLNTPM